MQFSVLYLYEVLMVACIPAVLPLLYVLHTVVEAHEKIRTPCSYDLTAIKILFFYDYAAKGKNQDSYPIFLYFIYLGKILSTAGML